MMCNCIRSKNGSEGPNTAGNVLPLPRGEVRVVRGEILSFDHLAERSEQSESGERNDRHFVMNTQRVSRSSRPTAFLSVLRAAHSHCR